MAVVDDMMIEPAMRASGAESAASLVTNNRLMIFGAKVRADAANEELGPWFSRGGERRCHRR